jgi:PIN domain nuclease of toxin-antitoxin system
MNLLLDTHILLWHLTDNSMLTQKISQLIENPQHKKFVSIVTLWEIAIKRSLGKLKIEHPIEKLIPPEMTILPLEISHISYLEKLPFHHRDPFDRIIIAQAIVEKLSVITNDGDFEYYEIDLIK